MATHTHLPIYKVAYDLLDAVTDFARSMPRDFKQSIGGKISAECIEIMALVFRANVAREDLFATANSYFGLLRQTSHSHHDRTRLANLLRDRGHCVKADMTNIYRTKEAAR